MDRYEAEFLGTRMSETQVELVMSLLTSGDEEDDEIRHAFGRRRLTDAERESLRNRLAQAMPVNPDGEPTQLGKEIDDLIGLLRFY